MRAPAVPRSVDGRSGFTPSSSAREAVTAIWQLCRMPGFAPGCYVRAQADLQPPVKGLARRKDGVGKIQVRQRAVRDPRFRSLDYPHVRIIDEVAMSKDRLRGQQAETVKAQRVGLSMAFEYVCVFPVAFGTMGLHMAVGALRQVA